MRTHAEALRALNLDDDLRGPADALARSYDDLGASLDDLEDDATEPDPTDLDRYEVASDRYHDANDDVRLACRDEQPLARNHSGSCASSQRTTWEVVSR